MGSFGGVFMTEMESCSLLKQCDTGVRMGLEALDQATTKIKDPAFLDIVKNAYDEHKRMQEEIEKLECKMQMEKPQKNQIVSALSRIKSDFLFAINNRDSTVAKLMTDGAFMGINALEKHLNRTPFASVSVRDIAEEIVDIEDDFLVKIRPYL